MPRRLLALAIAALALVASAGCADDVSPAVRVGDTKIGNDALLDEVDEWAQSPTLLGSLQLAGAEGDSPGTRPTEFVGFVLGNRIIFELHNAKFEELGLELTEQALAQTRGDFFGNPETTATVLGEMSPAYGDRLVEDLTRQFTVIDALDIDYEAWINEAANAGSIEVNPRYGSWNGQSGQVDPPAGPTRPLPPADPFTP